MTPSVLACKKSERWMNQRPMGKDGVMTEHIRHLEKDNAVARELIDQRDKTIKQLETKVIVLEKMVAKVKSLLQ